MKLLNDLWIKIFCKKIGEDEFGNQYFSHKNGKRFVLYKGIAEPTKIPMQWHGWVHYSTNIVPVKINTHHFSWQKIHLPNLSGTKLAYSPKNSSTSNSNSSYQAWKPENHE